MGNIMLDKFRLHSQEKVYHWAFHQISSSPFPLKWPKHSIHKKKSNLQKLVSVFFCSKYYRWHFLGPKELPVISSFG